ncbi:MAG: AraC family transcriptional regulator [Bacteroidota bacterium]
MSLSTQNLKLVDLLHYLPFVVLLPFSWFIPNEGPASYHRLFALFYNAISFHMAGYILFTVFWFFQKRHTNILHITVQKKQWLLYFLGINLLFVCFYLLVSFFLFSLYIGLSFFFSFLVFFCSFWALRHPQLFEIPVYKYQRSTLSTEEAGKIMTALTDYFQESRPYLDPSLTLSKLEEVLQIPVKHLSQAINQIEKMNYAQFVQQYRVEEAKRLLQSKAHRQWTIASIAYDSGFNSISSFNTAFKRITGLTPLTFQKSNEK